MAILHLHKVGNDLKRSVKKLDIWVVFSEPNKLGTLGAKIIKCSKQQPHCKKRHRKDRVNSSKRRWGYAVPHLRGAVHIGQGGRWVSERLRTIAHHKKSTASWRLADSSRARLRVCFGSWCIAGTLGRHPHRRATEVREAWGIVNTRDQTIIGEPSVSAREMMHMELAPNYAESGSGKTRVFEAKQNVNSDDMETIRVFACLKGERGGFELD